MSPMNEEVVRSPPSPVASVIDLLSESDEDLDLVIDADGVIDLASASEAELDEETQLDSPEATDGQETALEETKEHSNPEYGSSSSADEAKVAPSPGPSASSPSSEEMTQDTQMAPLGNKSEKSVNRPKKIVKKPKKVKARAPKKVAVIQESNWSGSDYSSYNDSDGSVDDERNPKLTARRAWDRQIQSSLNAYAPLTRPRRICKCRCKNGCTRACKCMGVCRCKCKCKCKCKCVRKCKLDASLEGGFKLNAKCHCAGSN